MTTSASRRPAYTTTISLTEGEIAKLLRGLETGHYEEQDEARSGLMVKLERASKRVLGTEEPR